MGTITNHVESDLDSDTIVEVKESEMIHVENVHWIKFNYFRTEKHTCIYTLTCIY